MAWELVCSKHLNAYIHSLDNDFIEILSIFLGSFLSLVLVWQGFCNINIKYTQEKLIFVAFGTICSESVQKTCENTGLGWVIVVGRLILRPWLCVVSLVLLCQGCFGVCVQAIHYLTASCPTQPTLPALLPSL